MTEPASPAAEADRPWLSILIPAYNVEPYLEECLNSIFAQADDGVQIILCEDCSTDRTYALAKRIEAENPQRLRVIKNSRNRGLSATRNTMIEYATGDYLWFIDSDDTLRPGAIAAVKDCAENRAPDIISGDYHKRIFRKFAFTGKRGQIIRDRGEMIAGICKSRKMYAWLKICHRRVWKDGPWFPEGKSFEDAAVTPWLPLKARSMVHLNRSLIQYRIRPGSILSGITRTPGKFAIESHFDLAHSLDGFAEAMDQADDGTFDEARFAVSHFIAMEFTKIAERIERAGPEGCEGEDIQRLAKRFFEIMNAASPIAFEQMSATYAKRGRMISRFKLQKALRFLQHQA